MARCSGSRLPIASSRQRSTISPETRRLRDPRHNAAVPTRYDFLLDTYRTERLKTLTLWSQIPDDRMNDRVEERARSPREHMVHQSLSEEAWMRNMLGIHVSHPL